MEKADQTRDTTASNFKGQFLIAMPGMSDPRFERSVVYLCAHSSAGAMGMIINKPLEDITLTEIIIQLVEDGMPDNVGSRMQAQDQIIYRGGPVEQGRGFVLHSTDYNVDSTLDVDAQISLTSSIDILKDIALGNGPDEFLMVLGYAGWSAGQLEAEVAENGWINCEASTEILFDANSPTKYDRALAQLGIDPALLSSDAGHA